MSHHQKLFRATFRVVPTSGHPQYHQVAYGVLAVLLFAKFDCEARERATAIVKQLPYEVRRPFDVLVVEVFQDRSALPQDDHAAYRFYLERLLDVELSGCSMWLDPAPAGEVVKEDLERFELAQWVLDGPDD
jgi:hypothetical protein